MKVCHLAEFGPHRSGLYGTTRDMVMAEQIVGIDAGFVDTKIKDSKVISRPNLKDGTLPIRDIEWAKTADILVHHSIVPKELANLGIPMVLVMHGRPESTFLLEHRRISSIFGVQLDHGDDSRYKAFITFWEQYLFHLKMIVPKDKLFYVPAPVNLSEYKPFGKPHALPGKPSLLIADMWRQDVTPFNTIMAAARFKEKYCPEAKLNLIGTAPKKKSIKSLKRMLKDSGILGQVHPLVVDTHKCYRGADIVLTSHNIATRVVRETLACGTSLVAGTGNPYTLFTAESREPELFAAEINRCWQYIQDNGADIVRAENRLKAENSFHPKLTGEAAKKIYEKILEDAKPNWRTQGTLQRKIYPEYGDYVQEQKSKYAMVKDRLGQYDANYREALRTRLEASSDYWPGQSVLCLGARQGTEVKAFLDVGCFAVGIDLEPGNKNKYVVTGDFHKLQYPDSSVDVIFCNSIDHIYRIRTFLSEVTRVLKPDGLLIIEIEGPREKDSDRYACLHWKSSDDLIALFKEFGLNSPMKTAINDKGVDAWFTEHIVFEYQEAVNA